MKITKDSVVFFNYTITDSDGTELERTEGEPANFIHGLATALPAIEEVLLGKEDGFKTTLTLQPDAAFGHYDSAMVINVPLIEFKDEEIAVGMEFVGDDDDEDELVWRISKITDKEVTMDANHPYAGKTLTFAIEVVKVREATEEELDHGHIHDE
jgi:FKBP-type peptidyl-prolyl cis-trans isomerase SlyD